MTSNDVFCAQILDRINKMSSHAYQPGEYFRRFQAETIANEHQSDENNEEESDVSTDVQNVDEASVLLTSSTPSTSRHPDNNSQKTGKRKAMPASDTVASKKS